MDADQYDAWYETRRGQWIGQQEYALISAELYAQAGDSLLDVGCGTGWFTRKFANEKQLTVTGLDTDLVRLGLARSKDQRSSYLQADAKNLPFPNSSFDHVVSITALPFILDWPRAIAEIVRVANDRFVLGLLNRHSLLSLQKGQGDGVGAYRGAHWHTAQEISNALDGLAVSKVKIQSCIFLPSGLAHARLIELVVPSSLLCGAFLVVSGRKRTN